MTVALTQRWNERWTSLYQTRAGAAFITGSGTSLLSNDFSRLADRDVFAMNHSLWFLPDYIARWWTFTDWPREFRAFLPAALARGITIVRNMNHPKPPMAHDLIYNINACDVPGHAVQSTLDLTLGLVAHMGYARAYLIGCDGTAHNVAYETDQHYRDLNACAIYPRIRDGIIEVMSTGAVPSANDIAHHDLDTALEFDSHVRWNARTRNERAS